MNQRVGESHPFVDIPLGKSHERLTCACADFTQAVQSPAVNSNRFATHVVNRGTSICHSRTRIGRMPTCTRSGKHGETIPITIPAQRLPFSAISQACLGPVSGSPPRVTVVSSRTAAHIYSTCILRMRKDVNHAELEGYIGTRGRYIGPGDRRCGAAASAGPTSSGSTTVVLVTSASKAGPTALAPAAAKSQS